MQVSKEVATSLWSPYIKSNKKKRQNPKDSNRRKTTERVVPEERGKMDDLPLIALLCGKLEKGRWWWRKSGSERFDSLCTDSLQLQQLVHSSSPPGTGSTGTL